MVGAGSFDLAEYTRSSSFCILPISPRIWYREPDLGRLPAGLPPTLGLGPFCAGAVVLIDGVARPVVPDFADMGMLGPRECRGGRDWYMPGRGVVDGSSAIEPFRAGIGVTGTALALTDASDKGGDGGVASVRTVSALECGGVEAVVGDDKVVAEVAVSERGERGRRFSAASNCEVLRWWWPSIVCSARRNFSWTISASIRRSESSSRIR